MCRCSGNIGGRNREKREEAVHVIGCVEDELAIRLHDLGALLERPERWPRVHALHRLQPELERRHDAEVAAAAAQRPEKIGMRTFARGYETAVGHTTSADRRLSIVRPGPACARQPMPPPRSHIVDEMYPQRPKGHPPGMVDVGPHTATAASRPRAHWIDANSFHLRQLMTMPSSQVPRPPPSTAATAAANRGQHVVDRA